MFSQRQETIKQDIEQALSEVIDSLNCPSCLRQAMAYSLLGGGKRLRGMLVLLTAELFKLELNRPMPIACAFEMIHAYSLIHDDLPALDNDDYRRGRPSNHKQFGEALALLAGDALLTHAFAVAAEACRTYQPKTAFAIMCEIARAAGPDGMVGGQVIDTVETGHALSLSELEKMHNLKTGAMISAAVRCGALLGGAEQEQLDRLGRYGQCLGLAFQVVDDILDVTGSKQELGKTIGKDSQQGKTTYVSLLGIEQSQQVADDLLAEAKAIIEPFGSPGRPLIDLAEYIGSRRK